MADYATTHTHSSIFDLDRRTATLMAMCLAVLMVQLDTTVANLALHELQRQLKSSVEQLQWVIDGYNLVYGACILIGGTLGDIYGRKRIFLIGALIFTIGMVLCALSVSATMLIASRAFSGFGAALALPGSLSILRVAYQDAHERARAVSIWAGTNGVAIAIGPTVGGALIHALGWRSVFYAVAPVGALALGLAALYVDESADPEGRRLDLPGQTTAILCLGLLAFAAIEGTAVGWGSLLIRGALVGAATALFVFLFVETKIENPLMPLDVFANRSFSAALVVTFAMTFGMYAFLFMFPLYLQTVRHATPLQAGIDLLPQGVSFALISPFAAALAHRFGTRAMIAAGMFLIAGGIFAVSGASTETSMTVLFAEMLVIGIGLGFATGPLMAVALASIPSERAGLASGLVNTARLIGATLGVAILGALFAARVGHAGSEQAQSQSPEHFLAGMSIALLVGATVELIGACVATALIRGEAHVENQ
jgi:MFS transporter, DHA2 family, methylenomycin A resistance protein